MFKTELKCHKLLFRTDSVITAKVVLQALLNNERI